MALMYPWATKEYLLWEMDLAQLILYHNKGIEVKDGKPNEAGASSVAGYNDMDVEELRRLKNEADEIFKQDEKTREQLRAQYGAIDG